MANIEVKLRRGTEAEHDTTSGGFTGAEGEVTVDTTNDTLRVHDGSTAGGVRLAKYSELASAGTGTVTSVDSGTGLTGGPITTSGTLSIADDGVSFAKMQDINTAKVIGRTTAGVGNPEEVSILDEDAMTTDSDTALATQQSIKAYVDSQVTSVVSKYSTGWATSHGGTTVANGATLTITHNLGTTDVTASIFVNSSASDTGAKMPYLEGNYGWQLTNLTSSTITVQLGISGYIDMNTSGQGLLGSYASKYVKVVVIG